MKKVEEIICLAACLISTISLTSCSDKVKLAAVGVSSEIFGEETVGRAVYVINEANEYFDMRFSYEDGYEDGVITESGWKNEYFNIKFSLPENYSMQSKDELKELDSFSTKNEMGASYERSDESGQLHNAGVIVQVSQLPSGMSDEKLQEILKGCVSQEGFKLIAEGTMTIAGEKHIAYKSEYSKDGETMLVERADRRKGDKLLTFIFTYYPKDEDVKLGKYFSRLK